MNYFSQGGTALGIYEILIFSPLHYITWNQNTLLLLRTSDSQILNFSCRITYKYVRTPLVRTFSLKLCLCRDWSARSVSFSRQRGLTRSMWTAGEAGSGLIFGRIACDALQIVPSLLWAASCLQRWGSWREGDCGPAWPQWCGPGQRWAGRAAGCVGTRLSCPFLSLSGLLRCSALVLSSGFASPPPGALSHVVFSVRLRASGCHSSDITTRGQVWNLGWIGEDDQYMWLTNYDEIKGLRNITCASMATEVITHNHRNKYTHI